MCGIERCPVIVENNGVETYENGAVIVDVSIDTEAAFETLVLLPCRKKPTFIKAM
jgi:alanine dehydrogenase